MSPEPLQKPDVPRFHKRFTIYLLGVFAILFLALLVFVAKQYRSNELYQQTSLLIDFQEEVTHIENLLAMVTSRVEGMRIRAESDLLEMHRAEELVPPLAFYSLTETEEQPGPAFHLDEIRPPLTVASVGNLTGLGTLRNRDSAFYRELYLALTLNPDFRAISQTIKDAAWVYYTSAANFINIYPWVSSTKFKFSKELHTHEFFRLGAPDKNPERKLFWTEVYVDEYGKGLMTTCAAPVYDQDRFLGTVAIDLTVDFLNSVVGKFHSQSGEMFLVNERLQILARPSLITSADRHTKSMEAALPVALRQHVPGIMKINEDELVAIEGYELVRRQIGNAPWQAIYVRPARAELVEFVSHVGVGPLLLIAGLLLMVVTVLRVTHRKFIVPSGLLVDFIMRRSHQESTVGTEALPSFWKPWFEAIDGAFRENEELTEKIRKQNEELERRVAERTASLEESNRALHVQFEERRLAEREKERLRLQLQQAQTAESLGRMAGAIAHHFNNKLGVIMGNLELALLGLPKESKIRGYLDSAMVASGQSVEMSRLMLTYLGQTVGEKKPLDLTRTVREALVALGALLPEQISLRTADLPAQGPTILADSGQITLMLTNLVTNAVEAIGGQAGEIVLGTGVKPASVFGNSSYSPLDWEPVADRYACLSVSDTGCGMAADIHERIFDPFYTTKFMGRGLGLAVVYGIVKAHEGAIIVESQPGQGASFHLFFPLLPDDGSPTLAEEQGDSEDP